MKGNVGAPQQPRSPLPLLTPPRVMTPVHAWKRFKVREAYPKGSEGWLVNDQRFIEELEKYLVKDIYDTCVQNKNPRAKLKSSDTNSNLIYKRVFADFLSLAPRHYGCM